MAKYNFSCKCGHKTQRYLPASVELLQCPACLEMMTRDLPMINSQTQVKEIVDPYTNKRLNKDHDELIRERRDEHYWTVEVPRLVEKYSVETCIEQGWLVYNDKGELVINKPPSKR
jgi:hypothetical protein